MINVLFVWVCFLLVLVTGIIMGNLINIGDTFLRHKGILIMPGLGIIFMMNTIQILNLIIPISWLIYPYIFFLILGIAKYYESIISYLKQLRLFIAVTALITIVWMLPFLGKQELVSVQVWNNDIIFYLASMEWLQDYASTKAVVYDSTHPLYWCAEYMLERTRTGFDGFGSFIMSLFALNAHNVFSCLGVVFGITILFDIYYILSTVCKVPIAFKLPVIIIIALVGRIDELMIYQYVPQLCGIALFLLFIALIVQYFYDNTVLRRGILALVLSGIITVYAEFCSYLAIIFLGAVIIALTKGKIQTVKNAFAEGIFAVLLNPVGTWRALKLNLFVLINANENMSNIDPFDGETASLPDVITQLFGACQTEKVIQYLRTPYIAVLLFLVFCLFLMWCYYIFKINDERKAVFLFIVGFLSAYEAYFRFIGYGYGEYKHLISSTIIILVLCCYVVYQFVNSFKRTFLAWGIYLVYGLFFFICGVNNIYSNLLNTNMYYYDSSLMAISEIGHLVPDNESIGIGGTPATIHGSVYALKEHSATILSNYISYIPYSSEASSRYQLFEGDYSTRQYTDNERFVWGNGRFYLIENTDLQAVFYTGFHLPETEDTSLLYTCDIEASVVIYNYSDDVRFFSAAFQSEPIGDDSSRIRLMVNGDVIAYGNAGDYIMTDMLILEPGDSLRLYIYYDGELTSQDDQIMGFKIKEWKLISYA